jgi:predicted enzyme related to lactoylglutathione lyase
MSKNPVVHFEMPYDDAKRVAAFYEQAFGWKMNVMGEEMQNYITADTTEVENGRPKNAGEINGGFYPKSATTAQVPSVVIAVDDIQAAIAAVTKAGGKVLGEPMNIPGIGEYVSFTDSEGNRVSLLKPGM